MCTYVNPTQVKMIVNFRPGALKDIGMSGVVEAIATALLLVKWTKFRIFLMHTIFVTWLQNIIKPIGVKAVLLGENSELGPLV